MSYEITRITPLAKPKPIGNLGRMVVAEFTIKIGPVSLMNCSLTHRENKGFRVALPSLWIKMDNVVRSEIKRRVRDAYLALKPVEPATDPGDDPARFRQAQTDHEDS